MTNLTPPPQPPTTTVPQPIPPPPNLFNTLEHLTSLLQLTADTLTSLPTTLANHHPTSAALPCPHDSNHLIPPSSLFSHYLNCPSTVRIPQITPATSFFYRNCPSAVTLPPDHPAPQAPTLFKLPPIFLNACDVSNQQNPWTNRDAYYCAKLFLPSEIWHLRRELESWGFGGHAPISCPYSVLRALTRLRHSALSFLREWLVGRSLKYGVVIDFSLADHIIVLIGLCLKALLMSMAEEKIHMYQSFECPVLGEVLIWLGSQLTVLYGEVNGRYFAVDMMRECVLESASRACLFPLDGKSEDSSEIKEVVSGVNEHLNIETFEERRIFVSQVEEAVAKLHERAVMEEHIKTLRGSQLLTTFQRYKAHEHMLNFAESERKRRPDYKPIIEHDGLLWQRLNEKDNGTTKTREELLAEERDYKRRRMSYRGKRSKRNPLEVTRDIIEEYMEAIKVAGGIIGSHTNAEKTEALAPENLQRQSGGDRSASTKRSANESRQKSHDDRSKHGREYSIRNVKSEGTTDREKEIIHVEYSVEGSKQKPHKKERKSPENNYLRRYKDGDGCRRQHNDHKRCSDDEDSSRRKRKTYKDDREYERDGNRRRRKSKTRNNSSGHEAHKFGDRYDPANSENAYEDLD